MTLAPTFASQLRAFASDIKLAHTIFAMPFAVLSMCLASVARDSRPRWGEVGLVLACMIFARSFAMGMNRLLDAAGDSLNPRTRNRAIPAGRLSRTSAFAITTVCALGFALACSGFAWFYSNFAPAIGCGPALCFIGAYPLLKLHTRWVHYYLGAALGLAPICAWLAITPTLSPVPIVLGLAVLCWTAGFDILYATQDYENDLRNNIHSIPAKLGIVNALRLSRATHAISIALLLVVGTLSEPLHMLWFLGCAIAAGLLIYEQSLVKPSDLSKINLAFFTLNGVVSIVLGVLGVIDCFV